jgi:hypothetical protein
MEDGFTISIQHTYDDLSHLHQLTQILSRYSSSISVAIRWFEDNSLHISWRGFEAITCASGSSLECLDDILITADSQELRCPSIFGNFPVLRVLDFSRVQSCEEQNITFSGSQDVWISQSPGLSCTYHESVIQDATGIWRRFRIYPTRISLGNSGLNLNGSE